MSTKRVALFGGAFDPAHRGHVQVATAVAMDEIDEIWFVPVFKHPWAVRFGKEVLAPYQHRLAMLELVVRSNQRIAEYLDVSYTFPTLEYFSNKHPDVHFSWIMGSEYISKFDAFLEGHPGLAEYTFYVYPRKDFPLQGLYPNMVGLHEMDEVTVSSTQIREALKQGASIDHLVTPEVGEYIAQHALYQK